MNRKFFFSLFSILILCCISAFIASCAGNAASAQEYFSIGMAYYELGKFDEAEKWLNRAKSADRTLAASQYNLGRIAFETQKYGEAAKHFEDILKKDPDNVLALKAAAYTRIKTGDIEIADRHYKRLLELVPESADDGYNHALVLYAMERYGESEKVLEKYRIALQENSDVLLLYARSQKAQGKAEAIDNYDQWLKTNTGLNVRYEYAQILESQELYARALEEYRLIISELRGNQDEPKRGDIRFALARLLLIADSDSAEGITEMEAAVKDGFEDIEAVEEIMNSDKTDAARRESLRNIINSMQRAAEEKSKAQEPAAEENIETEQEEPTETPSEDPKSDSKTDIE
ncbi:MAG: tetratricopeptide repeat protein [Treponema sp.]|jgi:tetratricopeptide (TPR) repeat protein|nr:tetratricopeptide repeat protein [Treponema sp.]